MLPDSAHIQEEEARDANRRGYSRHKPALPLYTELDAARALTQLQPVGYERPVPVVPGWKSSSSMPVTSSGRRTLACDLETRPSCSVAIWDVTVGPCCRTQPPVNAADILLLESTYGNRQHPPDDGGAQLAAIINETVKRGGRLIIPSFAVGRVEELSTGSSSSSKASGFRCFPCTSIARWRREHCSSTRNACTSSTPSMKPTER